MDKIPLSLRMKKEAHRKIAYAQDLIVEEIYKEFNKAVLHGGTAIWRCFAGKRFSEDLDFYISKNEIKINKFFDSLEKKGFKIIKKKILERSIYSELEFNRSMVRFEATFQKIDGVITDYETSSGNIISIYSLTPESFIIEKVDTYLKRFKIRDLWDLFFLLRSISDFSLIKEKMNEFIKNYKNPIDELDLKTIILDGIVPSSQEMFNYIKQKWEKPSI